MPESLTNLSSPSRGSGGTVLRTIRVCAGIGDNIWLIQKLVNAKEQFRFVLPGESPKRGKQIFDLIPSLSVSAKYDDGFTSLEPIHEGVQRRKNVWAQITEPEFYLSANEHLEQGHRLETFLPDLDTSFRLPWATEAWRARAESLCSSDGLQIGLYGSSYSTTRHWGFWGAREWEKLALGIASSVKDVTFIVIGAEFDGDLTWDLAKLLDKDDLTYRMLVGKPLGLVVEVMKRLDYLFAFPSGIGILAPSVECPTMMFHPKHLEKLIGTWADPVALRTKSYKGLVFCTPERALQVAVEECGLQARLGGMPVRETPVSPARPQPSPTAASQSFLHSGGAGDVIYSLPLVRHLQGGVLYLKPRNIYNTVCNVHLALKRLLERQWYIREVREYDAALGFFQYDPKIRTEVDLDKFRQVPELQTLKFPLCYFKAHAVAPPDGWSEPWLWAEPRVPVGAEGGFALINRTARYHAPRFDWNATLEAIVLRHEKVFFIGLPEEHEAFVRETKKEIAHLPTFDLWDVACYLEAAAALYCNQGACLTIAQALGRPYYLEVLPGQKSCILGGTNEWILNS